MKKILNIFGDITKYPKKRTDVSAEIALNQTHGLTSNDELEVNINSLGGDVFEAVAISNIIHSYGCKLAFNILGVCASAATMLFNADDEVGAANGILSMYHEPQTEIEGDSHELRARATLLDKIRNENIVKNLVARTGKSEEMINNLIRNEWWLNYDESLSILGFKPISKEAVFLMNSADTTQLSIYNKYIEKKKALNNNAFNQFINFKNNLRK